MGEGQEMDIMAQMFGVNPDEHTCDTIYTVKTQAMTANGLVIYGTVKVVLQDLSGKIVDTKEGEGVHRLLLPDVRTAGGEGLETTVGSGLDDSMYQMLSGNKPIAMVIIGDKQATHGFDTLNVFSTDGTEAVAVGLNR